MDNCKQIEKLLSAYADGELNEQQKALVAQHVAHCPHCAALLDEYLALNAAIADCAVQAPEGFTERVMQAVEREQKAPVKPQGRGVRLGRIAPFVGIGVAAVLCISIVSSSLVRYVTKNLVDNDYVSEQVTEALGGQAPSDPWYDESLEAVAPQESMEAATVPATDDECESLADTNEETVLESPTCEQTEMEGIYPEQDPTPETIPETMQPETIPETMQPETIPETIPETVQPETDGVRDETQAPVESEQPEEPETEAATPEAIAPAPEDAPSGFFARIWQAVEAFFEKLLQSISRLFGGDA